MNRRRYLQTVATAGAAATAGCLGVLGDSGAEGTVLGPPEVDLSEAVHPSYGDEMPEFTVPDPIAGEEVSVAEFEGERALLWTAFYTNCPDGVCPALILRLRRAQEVVTEEGYGDSAAFLALTFDPERDTADVLGEYADRQGVDLDAGNWHFLRPESYERGQELLDEQFGLVVEKTPADEYENLEYRFPHYGLILLVNERGIVERAYPNGPTVDIETLVDDFTRVVTA
jgi:protein SCO1/2